MCQWFRLSPYLPPFLCHSLFYLSLQKINYSGFKVIPSLNYFYFRASYMLCRVERMKGRWWRGEIFIIWITVKRSLRILCLKWWQQLLEGSLFPCFPFKFPWVRKFWAIAKTVYEVILWLWDSREQFLKGHRRGKTEVGERNGLAAASCQ